MQSRTMLAGAVMSVGLAAAGLGLAAGTALALPSEPHQWCPGDSIYPPTGPGAYNVDWDMNVCHTWTWVRYGHGNVKTQDGAQSNVWDGPNPPPDLLVECGTGLFGGPIRC
jgi:hypothetical protein